MAIYEFGMMKEIPQQDAGMINMSRKNMIVYPSRTILLKCLPPGCLMWTCSGIKSTYLEKGSHTVG